MKPITPHMLLTVAAILSLPILSGCYTEMALVSDEPANSGDPYPGEIYQPDPVVYVPIPIVVVPDPVYIPVPVAGTPAPQVGTGHQNDSGRRDFGYQRTGGSNGNAGQRGESIRNQPAPRPDPAPRPLPPVVNTNTRTNTANRGRN